MERFDLCFEEMRRMIAPAQIHGETVPLASLGRYSIDKPKKSSSWISNAVEPGKRRLDQIPEDRATCPWIAVKHKLQAVFGNVVAQFLW